MRTLLTCYCYTRGRAYCRPSLAQNNGGRGGGNPVALRLITDESWLYTATDREMPAHWFGLPWWGFLWLVGARVCSFSSHQPCLNVLGGGVGRCRAALRALLSPSHTRTSTHFTVTSPSPPYKTLLDPTTAGTARTGLGGTGWRNTWPTTHRLQQGGAS